MLNRKLTALTTENAPFVSVIECIDHPEWGTKRFNFDCSKDKHHSHGCGSNSAVLFESEFKFWRVVSFNSRNTPEQIAKRLNAHHLKTCAGFYSATGGRFFQARAVGDVLEVSPDFGETWFKPMLLKFHDHNGRDIIIFSNAKQAAKGRG